MLRFTSVGSLALVLAPACQDAAAPGVAQATLAESVFGGQDSPLVLRMTEPATGDPLPGFSIPPGPGH